MATDLEPRKTSSKSEAYLQRKFADLGARVKRIDLIAHLLVVSLAVVCYALFIGLFDWFADNSTALAVGATRWISFGGLLGLVGFLLVQTIRCGLRRVNPYFVAHQLEATLPDAKNSLINWLDLHDETLPSAFQKTLSARAAEQLEESDIERTLPKRTNWILLGSLAAPLLGLVVLLLLGPSAFGSSMLRAFLPFYTPAPIARTHIELVLPAGGDAEVNPTESMTFIAKIEGRVPVGNRPDAPTLSYRYDTSEDYLTLPLQSDGAGAWTTQLQAARLRTGFAYKISAGDAETREFQVRVRTRTHVKKFEITYQHRTYRKLPTGPFMFPNEKETRPIIRGPRGSDVELVVRASRPMQKPSVEIMTAGAKQKLEVRKLADDAFSCRLTLDQSGQFRVAFISSDGEENSDRDWHAIEVQDDDAPRVVLTSPAKDVQVPENGTLAIEGLATSNVGLKNLTLHLRDVANAVTLAPMIYRPEISFLLDDGTYLAEIPYLDVVDFTKLKTDKDTTLFLPAGTVIEYWLEATDCSDYRKPAGNVRKSSVYKITLTAKVKEDPNRKAALDQKTKHDKKQDTDVAAQKKQGKPNQGSGDSPNPEEQYKAAEREKQDFDKKIQQGHDQDKKDKETGTTKSAQPQNADAKPEPQPSPDAPQPQTKDSPTMPEDAGSKKEQGNGASGEAKNDGAKEKPDDSATKGERKNGPEETGSGAKDAGEKGKDGPPGGAKDAGPMGMNTPKPADPKESAADEGAPMASAKASKAEMKDGPPPASVKGVEQNGPEVPNKGEQAKLDPSQPPNGHSKGGKMNEGSGESKQGSPDQASQPGSARGDDSKAKSNEPSWGDIAKMNEQLSKHDAAAEKAAQDLAGIANSSDDPGKSDIAKEALKANGRDPKTGKEEKTKGDPFGSYGKSPGISDDLKAAAANRLFAARIGQMQLDDWKKRMTPELLRKAGLSDADWQRYQKTMQAHDARVRQLNAKLFRDALNKELIGSANATGSVRDVPSTGTSSDPLDSSRVPPDLQGPNQRFSNRKVSASRTVR